MPICLDQNVTKWRKILLSHFLLKVSGVQPDNVMQDLLLGKNVKRACSSTSSVGIILQNSFEVINHLGCGRLKRKVLAMYLTLQIFCPITDQILDMCNMHCFIKNMTISIWTVTIIWISYKRFVGFLAEWNNWWPDGQLDGETPSLGSHNISVNVLPQLTFFADTVRLIVKHVRQNF